MANVFLSYARENAAKVGTLAACLEQAGHTVWWDQHISGGEQFSDAIEKALESADVVVVAWSAAAVRSAWVRDEAALGRDTDRLVPVSLDGTEPPLGFRQYNTIELLGWHGRADAPPIARVRQAIAAKAGEPHKLLPKRFVRAALPSRRLFGAGAAIALLLALGGLFYTQLLPWGRSDRLSPKVALGQFAVISPEVSPELERAMNEEILGAFGAENLVSVIAAGPSNAAAAPFLFDGSIRQVDDALRFTAYLKNRKTGAVIWSQAFDRATNDALAPRQVAVAASQVVRCGLWGASSYPRRMSDQALSLYLQWCNEYWGGSPDDERVLDAARRVTVALPDFSFGWSALALAAVPLAHQAASAEAGTIAREGWQAADKSIRFDEDNPEGYMAKAGLLPTERFVDREQLLKKAITVRPTECGCERQVYGDFLTSVGRMEEAVEQYERARAMMPLAPFSNLRLAHALHLVGRHDEADKVISDTLQIWPNASSLQLLKVKAAYWTADYAGAVPLLSAPDLHLASAQRDALGATFDALSSGRSGRKAEATAALEVLAADPRKNDRLIVGALAALDACDEALAAATRLIRARGHMVADVLFEPNLAGRCHSPAYDALVRNLGLTSYWKSSRIFPDICSKPRKPKFCAAA